MKLFMAASLCWAHHPKEVITIAKENNLQGVELWAEHMYYHQAPPEEIRTHAEQEAIALTLHASSWDLNICSLNQGIQEQSVKELKKSIDLAEALQVMHMTFHPGRFTVKNYLADEHMRVLVKNTKDLLAYAEMKQLTLSQELMEPVAKEIITTPKVMNTFLTKVGSGLKVTLDIAHTPLEERSMDYLNELHQVNSIHLSDTSKHAYHVPLGKGDIDLQAVLAQIDRPACGLGRDGYGQ